MLSALAAALACAQSAPTLERHGALDASQGHVIYLVATRQKERVAGSLQEFGFDLADDMLAASFYLRVTLGNEKGFKQCGTLNNVKYSLRQNGMEILLIRAAGWTGSCEPNVFDAMSRELSVVFESPGTPSRGDVP